MPHIHDLSAGHPVNHQTSLAKSFLLNLNAIGCRWFSRHGMHVQMPGKRPLAEMLVKSLTKVKQENSAYKPLAALASASCESPSPAAIYLHVFHPRTTRAHHAAPRQLRGDCEQRTCLAAHHALFTTCRPNEQMSNSVF
ncbi:hypothetical protein J6590_035620 [Homalodisca vitripennis]|nr:hypothetical protein J6590_035620 [Homalodisca vitripennis]